MTLYVIGIIRITTVHCVPLDKYIDQGILGLPPLGSNSEKDKILSWN